MCGAGALIRQFLAAVPVSALRTVCEARNYFFLGISAFSTTSLLVGFRVGSFHARAPQLALVVAPEVLMGARQKDRSRACSRRIVVPRSRSA